MEKEVIIGNDLSEIAHITSFIKELGGSLQLPPDVIMSISLALEEAIANIITHSYPSGGQHEISLKVTVSSDELLFVLMDDGVPFDIPSREEVWEALSQEQLLLDRLGIRLIHQIMDEVSYKYKNGKNLFTMKKKITVNCQKEKTMKANIIKVDDVTIITLEGRLDTVNAQEFEVIIRPLFEDKKPDIVINCEGLSYLSSSGIRIFILLQKNVIKNRGQLVLEAVKPQIHKIFDMTGCSSIFTIR